MLCGMLKQPGSVPGSPHERRSRPFGSYLWTREFPYPSEMKMSPVCGERATWVGRLKGFPPWAADGWSGSPIVSRSFPSAVNWRTVWLPSSVSHTESSGPIVMP